MRNYNIIADGKHYLSGVGHAEIKFDCLLTDEVLDVDLFCIDGVTYGAYIDPDDGYRSYGAFYELTDKKCQYTFPPQEVIVENIEINNEKECNDYGYKYIETEHKSIIKITDATNGKEVLVIGTDYSSTYYPMAIFHYTPENLEVNKNR